MARPNPLSGYPEWLPEQREVERQVLDSLRSTFELHGFAGIETRAVEPLSVLLSKGEIDKEVYVVRRLHADPNAAGSGGAAGSAEDQLALHFDMTVPFARYVLENAGKLQFPFRRYQIQKAWRGERPQEGRYREFIQADIDVIGRDTLGAHHEVEVAQVMADALGRLPLPPLTMQVNNRRLIQGFYRGLGIEDTQSVMRVVDKLDKVGPDGVADLLTATAGLTPAQAQACLSLATITATDASLADKVTNLGVTDPLLDQGVTELIELLEGAAGLGTDNFTLVADLRIARGLDYYTGTVYETVMQGFESLGSVCSGGRYDSLASDGRSTYPGVGVSFGVTRALAPLFNRGLLSASRSTPTCVLVVLPDEGSRADCATIAHGLRKSGVPTEVSPAPAKYGKQIQHAQRRGIPFVYFPAAATQSGEDEVRDIRTGVQVPAEGWSAPKSDLHPTIVTPEN